MQWLGGANFHIFFFFLYNHVAASLQTLNLPFVSHFHRHILHIIRAENINPAESFDLLANRRAGQHVLFQKGNLSLFFGHTGIFLDRFGMILNLVQSFEKLSKLVTNSKLTASFCCLFPSPSSVCSIHPTATPPWPQEVQRAACRPRLRKGSASASRCLEIWIYPCLSSAPSRATPRDRPLETRTTFY